jgi:hypothetical protein
MRTGGSSFLPPLYSWAVLFLHRPFPEGYWWKSLLRFEVMPQSHLSIMCVYPKDLLEGDCSFWGEWTEKMILTGRSSGDGEKQLQGQQSTTSMLCYTLLKSYSRDPSQGVQVSGITTKPHLVLCSAGLCSPGNWVPRKASLIPQGLLTISNVIPVRLGNPILNGWPPFCQQHRDAGHVLRWHFT